MKINVTVKKLIIKITLLTATITGFCKNSDNYFYGVLKPALKLDYLLPKKSTLEIANFFFWEIKATCSLKIVDPEAVITTKITEKYGIVNGIKLYKNDVYDFVLHNDEKLFISAPAGSAVALFNNSNHDIQATCSAS